MTKDQEKAVMEFIMSLDGMIEHARYLIDRDIRLPGDERCLAVAIDVQSELRALLKRSKAGG
jgi:hypothetical protein